MRIALLAGLVWPGAMLHARVYEVSGGSGGGNLWEPASFGRQVYHAVMNINGGLGEVSVVDCEGGVAAVRAACGDALAGGARFVAGESLGFGYAHGNGKTARMVTLVPGSKSLLVSVIQSDSEAKVAGGPLRHLISEMPLPSDAIVLSYMANADTRTAVERVSVRRPKDGLAGYYAEAMRQAGWTALCGGEAGMGVYVKGADLCCVMVSASDSDGESRATLLHKRGAVE